ARPAYEPGSGGEHQKRTERCGSMIEGELACRVTQKTLKSRPLRNTNVQSWLQDQYTTITWKCSRRIFWRLSTRSPSLNLPRLLITKTTTRSIFSTANLRINSAIS